jgi:hypothetical protein
MMVSNQALVSEVSERTFALRTRDLDPGTGAAHRAVLSDQLVKGELTGAVLVQPNQPFTVRMPMRRLPVDPDIVWWKPMANLPVNALTGLACPGCGRRAPHPRAVDDRPQPAGVAADGARPVTAAPAVYQRRLADGRAAFSYEAGG